MRALPRLFFAPDRLQEGPLRLDEAERHRLLRVLRLTDGAPLQLFDGAGRVAAARLTAGGHAVEAAAPVAAAEELAPLTVAVGMPSPERSDWLVEKLVELGATRILPLVCARSQGGGPQQALVRRAGRWERLTQAAGRQAQRLVLPRLLPQQRLDALPELPDGTRGFVADATRGNPSPLPPPPGVSLQLVVGPPGGLTDTEMGNLRARGYTSLYLGPHVLRSETAAVCATCLLLHGRG